MRIVPPAGHRRPSRPLHGLGLLPSAFKLEQMHGAEALPASPVRGPRPLTKCAEGLGPLTAAEHRVPRASLRVRRLRPPRVSPSRPIAGAEGRILGARRFMDRGRRRRELRAEPRGPSGGFHGSSPTPRATQVCSSRHERQGATLDPKSVDYSKGDQHGACIAVETTTPRRRPSVVSWQIMPVAARSMQDATRKQPPPNTDDGC